MMQGYPNKRPGFSSWLTTLLTLTIVCGLFLCGNTAFADTPNQRFGMVSRWDGTIASKMAELGAGIIRVDCDWGNIETSRGTYSWDCSDNAIYGANSYGIQVLLTVQCTPAWARSGGGCNTMPSNPDNSPVRVTR
jgi:hypothetical protein